MSVQGQTLVELNLDAESNDQRAVCHLMPCRIDHDQISIKAKEYFWPTIRELKSGGDNDQGRKVKDGPEKEKEAGPSNQGPILTASFRGRPLQGRCLKLPEGYTGYVTSKPTKMLGASARNKVIAKQFDQFTYWNWDQLPDKTDTVPKALGWLDISRAIHDPI